MVPDHFRHLKTINNTLCQMLKFTGNQYKAARGGTNVVTPCILNYLQVM